MVGGGVPGPEHFLLAHSASGWPGPEFWRLHKGQFVGGHSGGGVDLEYLWSISTEDGLGGLAVGRNWAYEIHMQSHVIPTFGLLIPQKNYLHQVGFDTAQPLGYDGPKEHSGQDAGKALSKMAAPRCLCLRDGQPTDIEAQGSWLVWLENRRCPSISTSFGLFFHLLYNLCLVHFI